MRVAAARRLAAPGPCPCDVSPRGAKAIAPRCPEDPGWGCPWGGDADRLRGIRCGGKGPWDGLRGIRCSVGPDAEGMGRGAAAWRGGATVRREGRKAKPPPSLFSEPPPHGSPLAWTPDLISPLPNGLLHGAVGITVWAWLTWVHPLPHRHPGRLRAVDAPDCVLLLVRSGTELQPQAPQPGHHLFLGLQASSPEEALRVAHTTHSQAPAPCPPPVLGTGPRVLGTCCVPCPCPTGQVVTCLSLSSGGLLGAQVLGSRTCSAWCSAGHRHTGAQAAGRCF